MPSVFACRNCDLWFQVGSYHGWNFNHDDYTILVCNECGLMYRLASTQDNPSHLIDSTLFYINLEHSPIHNDLDTNKLSEKNFPDEMLVSEAITLLNKHSLPDRISRKLQYHLDESQKIFKDSLMEMTIEQLRKACASLRYNELKRFAAKSVGVIIDSETYWKIIDGKIELDDDDMYLQGVDGYQILENGNLKYYDSEVEKRKTEIEAFKVFEDVECSNCHNLGSVSFWPKKNSDDETLCPQCHQPHVEVVEFWMT